MPSKKANSDEKSKSKKSSKKKENSDEKPKSKKAPKKKDSSDEKPKSKKSSKKSSKSENKSEEEDFETLMTNTKKEIDEYIKQGKLIKTTIDKLNKIHKKEIKSSGKKSKKEKDPNAPKHGILKPTEVPKEIAEFLQLDDPDELLPRTTVTKKIYEYISKHKLQDEENKTIIHPDKKLKKVFKMEDDEELTIKTFGTFLARCYPKSKSKSKSESKSKLKSKESSKKKKDEEDEEDEANESEETEEEDDD